MWTLSIVPLSELISCRDEFALAFLGNYKLTPTDRQLKRPSGSLTSSYGIITDVPLWHNDVKICLNFHIFEDLNFDFLIGHPVKALFSDVPKDRCLNIKLGKDMFHIPVDRALTCSVQDLPIPEPIGVFWLGPWGGYRGNAGRSQRCRRRIRWNFWTAHDWEAITTSDWAKAFTFRA